MNAKPQLGQTELMIAPKAQTNSATTTANLDTTGAEYAEVTVSFASEINTNAVGPTLSLLESDDTVATNFATVTADRTAEDITAAKNVVYHVPMAGRKKYLRLSVTTATATNDNITFAATARLHSKTRGPESTSDMVSSTNDAVVIVT